MDEADKDGHVSPSSQSLGSRACDNCRVRKIKCDRASPCSNCRVTNSVCRTSPRIKEQRQRILISQQYEKKIEAIDERLSGIERLLQDLALSLPASGQSQPSGHDSGDVPRQNEKPNLLPIMRESEDPTPGSHFEGESSFRAHSVLASEIFEKTMGSSPGNQQSPAMMNALSSLRDIVEKQNLPSSIHALRFANQRPGERVDISELELPPLEGVLSLLRVAKERFPTFFLTLPLVSLPRVTSMCKDLYFCTEEYSKARFAIVNIVLCYLFGEYSQLNPNDPRSAKFADYTTLCRSNFERVIGSFDLCMEPSYEHALVLALGAFHATENSKMSLCGNLIAHAARMCQALGYHRTVANKDDTENDDQVGPTEKKSLFWFIYLMDKDMSLCLGRSSTLQDYDIALDFPEIPSDPGTRSWTMIYRDWLNFATIVGQVYEQLYSARGLSDSGESRSKRAAALAEQVETWKNRAVRIEVEAGYYPEFLSWLIPGVEMSYYMLLTLIYRVVPPTNPPETPSGLDSRCIHAARKSLQVHKEVSTMFKNLDAFWWKGYVDWTLLQCPFAPFMIMFCHTISAYDLEDLKLLGEVVDTLQDAARVSEGGDRLYRLCLVFYQVAEVYVDAQVKQIENANTSTGYQTPVHPGAEFDGYLSALGLVPPMGTLQWRSPVDINGQRQEGVSTEQPDVQMTQSLEDWILNSQHMMGLLESDL